MIIIMEIEIIDEPITLDRLELAKRRWFTLSLAEQLGNAGSEFGRAAGARRRGDEPRFESAATRFFELMILTVADPRWRGQRRRELARVKELSGDALYGDDKEAAASLEKYFFQFALLARAGR